MLIELGRGPVDFQALRIDTALEEKFIDVPLGSRGIIVSYRGKANNGRIRLSSIKGEVSKTSTAAETARFLTIRGTDTLTISGLRLMSADAEHEGKPIADTEVEAGTMLEQRLYLTTEAANQTIEIAIIPGY